MSGQPGCLLLACMKGGIHWPAWKRRRGDRMRRREFIAVLGGAALARPFAVHAQPLATPVIGFLSSGTSEARAALTAAFRRGLAEIGYIEGQNVAIEVRWAQDRYDRLAGMAAEWVGAADA